MKLLFKFDVMVSKSVVFNSWYAKTSQGVRENILRGMQIEQKI
jgi:hypothetical protein